MDHIVTIDIEFDGEPDRPSKKVSYDEVADDVTALEGSRDVTMTISDDQRSERLMVAVDGSLAFLGLERHDGLLQFASPDPHHAHETRPFMIGGQESDIEVQYLLSVGTAAAVVRDWLKGVDSSAYGSWQLQ